MEEPVSTRIQRGRLLDDLGREDLELYGTDELDERIEGLKAEIERVEAQRRRKASSRDAADAIFNLPS